MTVVAPSRPLRDYQTTCIDLTYEQIAHSFGTDYVDDHMGDVEGISRDPFSGYYTLPTGTGKTRIATGLIEKLAAHGRVLVLAHRKELIEQMVQSIREDIPGADVGICMAERNQYSARIVVGSIQTLSTERLSQLFSVSPLWNLQESVTPLVAILIDECHHVQQGNSYDQLIQAVRAVSPQCAVIGCTATPYRSDTKPMQEILPTCTFSRTIPAMQEAGWLAPVTWHPIRCDLDTSQLRTSSIGGEKDYNAEDLESQLFPQSLDIVEKTIPLLENRPTVVFAATVRHAQELANLYAKALYHSEDKWAVRAWAIWGDMPKEQREYVLKNWKCGNIQIVVNVGILTEGFDYTPLAPNQEGLAAMVIARPTMSPSLYLQMLGRGTRLKPGSYQDCLIMDVVGNANLLETKQISLPKVMPTHAEDDEDLPGSHVAINDPTKPKKPQVLKINGPFEKSWAAWGLRDGVYYSGINGQSWAVLLPDARDSGLYEGYVLSKDGYEWYQERITARPGTLVDMMGHLNSIYAQNGVKALVDKKARWRKDLPSPKALGFLRSLNWVQYQLATEQQWNAGQVSLAIDYAVLQPHLVRLQRGNQ